jgi:hypothetical protein
MNASMNVHNFKGLKLCVGPSGLGFGLGLFIACDEESIRVPSNALLCGYAEGHLDMRTIGDKCVQFTIDSLDTLIYYNNKVTTVKQAVLEDGSCDRPLFSDRIHGHVLTFDSNNKVTGIKPNPAIAKRVFVPTYSSAIHPKNFGIYVNDFSYEVGVTKESYEKNDYRNCLKMIWLMEDSGSYESGARFKEGRVIVPLHPVLISKRDLVFNSKTPIELGISYGWDYWEYWARQF